MSVTHVVGVDPGLVHTGVVGLAFDPAYRTVTVRHAAIRGQDSNGDPRPATDVASETVLTFRSWPPPEPPRVFIEKYQPRSNFATDPAMNELLAMLKRAYRDAEVILNTGVKKVVGRKLMELLGVWSFSTATHHQDLRSAARIALYGMMKDESLNRLLADVVRDHLEGVTWNVHKQ